MQSRRERLQEELFIASPLRDLVPDDHILKRVDAILDLAWLHEEVRGVYCQDNGRPSIDPESALRLMLAGFFQGIVGDRHLMREAQVNLAIRWFAGYRLDEALPDRSSLTCIRQRWGTALFRRVFERTVAQCVAAGLVSTETVHVDATLIRADVSWESLTTRHVEQVIEANDEESGDSEDEPPARGRPRTRPPRAKKYSPTDPDATMVTSCRHHHLEPSYKQHTAVEDRSGVIVDVSVTTGEVNEGKQLLEQVDRIEATVGTVVECVTCDAAYAHGANFAALEERGTGAVIPAAPAAPRRAGEQRIPARRFNYDERHDRVTCPAGRPLERRGRSPADNGYIYRARACDCKACPLRERCIAPTARVRPILIVDGYTALLRARRRKETGWDPQTRDKYTRHRWRVEGVHGRAKTQHGLARAARRGLRNAGTLSYLTAAVMNPKILAAAWTRVRTFRTLTSALTTPPAPILRAIRPA